MTGYAYSTLSELYVDYAHNKRVGEVAALQRYWA
jgi:hypothetical protein